MSTERLETPVRTASPNEPADYIPSTPKSAGMSARGDACARIPEQLQLPFEWSPPAKCA